MNSKIVSLIALSMIAVAPMRVAASPQFLVYEGRNAIHDGQGGEKKVVDGVEFWFDGDPPHRFQVLGVITDRRMKTGLYGMIRMHGLEPDIAKMARSAGGDAVILQGQDDDVIGASGFSSAYATGGRGWASGFGSSFMAPMKAHESRYIVVKYLGDDPAGAPAAQPPAATTPAAVPLPAAPTAEPPPIQPVRRACGVLPTPDGNAKLVKC